MTVAFESPYATALLMEYLRMGENEGSLDGEQHETSYKPAIQKPLRQTEQIVAVKADHKDTFSNWYYP